uniref:Uncharacterized protein n=1 Tax=Romanomermis culicivorax TaxID=13658 RepID=A0A915KTR0_ROMCU
MVHYNGPMTSSTPDSRLLRDDPKIAAKLASADSYCRRSSSLDNHREECSPDRLALPTEHQPNSPKRTDFIALNSSSYSYGTYAKSQTDLSDQEKRAGRCCCCCLCRPGKRCSAFLLFSVCLVSLSLAIFLSWRVFRLEERLGDEGKFRHLNIDRKFRSVEEDDYDVTWSDEPWTWLANDTDRSPRATTNNRQSGGIDEKCLCPPGNEFAQILCIKP